jgi:DNA (cytosine-5)-methyltransferase 1
MSADRHAIPNHYAHNLSTLDLAMIKSVPPGGNWKDIPTSIPSRRLDQIRVSWAAGKGSRSTYYGRLRRDRCSYTINTYFGRPGNGCFIHYDWEGGQHRLISQREAARLQTFPDAFEFVGGLGAVDKQIGNAFPPLLAFQVGTALGSRAAFVDLFCGAGGLSLGLIWAGWEPLLGSDIDRNAVETYRRNVHRNVVLGDITDPVTTERICEGVERVRPTQLPMWVVGGPPCQGFSTAGNSRSEADPRNQLFWQYRDILDRLKPDGFLFENVPGLKSIANGRVLAAIIEALSTTGYIVSLLSLHAEDYGVPQRRHRLLLVGHRSTKLDSADGLPAAEMLRNVDTLRRPTTWNVEEALGDLPPLTPGQDGSNLAYASDPQNAFQRYARGLLGAGAVLER